MPFTPMKKIKLAAVSLTLLAMTTALHAEAITTSVCAMTELSPLSKPAIDLLGHAYAKFDCESPIGATTPASMVIVNVTEHDYANLTKILKSQAHVKYEFQGTYAGTLISYNGKKADNSPFKAERTGIESHGDFTTFTFQDLPQASVKNIFAAFQETGAVNLEQENIAVELSSPVDGIGKLKLTVRTKDISEQMIAVSNGIRLPNDQNMASDQIEISTRSAFVISNLLINAGMAVNQGSTPHRPGHYGGFWDYVYLDKDGQNPLFHCANVHSGESFTKCYFSQMRLK